MMKFTAHELFDPFGISRTGLMEVVLAIDHDRQLQLLQVEIEGLKNKKILKNDSEPVQSPLVTRRIHQTLPLTSR